MASLKSAYYMWAQYNKFESKMTYSEEVFFQATPYALLKNPTGLTYSLVFTDLKQ